MESMSLSFPSNISTSKPTTSKQTSGSAVDTVNFAALLGSVAAEGQTASEENVSENQQGALLEKLQETLQILQEIPKESLSPEEQEMMYVIVQLLSHQMDQIESQVSNVKLGQDKPIISNSVQEKLINLLQQIDQIIQKQSTVIKSFEGAVKLQGVEEKILSDPKKVEQVFKQLTAFIQQLDSEKQDDTGKQIEFKQLTQVEKLAKQMDSFTRDSTVTPLLTEVPRTSGQIVDASRTLTTQPVVVQVQQQDSSVMQVEPIQTEANGQMLTSHSSDVGKASQVPTRPEVGSPTPTPAPTVRVSNLIEELGGVLKGSFRLNSTQEATQIKVNIFPEQLGHLDIRLTASEGKIAAQIFTSNLLAKEVLELQVNQLRQSLLQQGVVIDRIEISQQSSQPSFGQQNAHPDQRFSQQQQKQGNASYNKNGYQRIEEEAAVERNHLSEGLMKVDYTI